jgi:hypothetical protein
MVLVYNHVHNWLRQYNTSLILQAQFKPNTHGFSFILSYHFFSRATHLSTQHMEEH